MAYFKLILHHELCLGFTPPPLLINVDGTAGTGKSFLIWAISTSLKQMLGGDPVVCLAPTGIAAFGIHGWTINFGLSISVKDGKDFSQLQSGNLLHLQT